MAIALLAVLAGLANSPQAAAGQLQQTSAVAVNVLLEGVAAQPG